LAFFGENSKYEQCSELAVTFMAWAGCDCFIVLSVCFHEFEENAVAGHPIVVVGASKYARILDVVFKRVMLKPLPSKLVMNMPESIREGVMFFFAVVHEHTIKKNSYTPDLTQLLDHSIADGQEFQL